MTASIVHPERYRATRDAVLERCRRLRLCEQAVRRCIAQAFDELASGRSSAVAVMVGNRLAERIAQCRVFVSEGGSA